VIEVLLIHRFLLVCDVRNARLRAAAPFHSRAGCAPSRGRAPGWRVVCRGGSWRREPPRLVQHVRGLGARHPQNRVDIGHSLCIWQFSGARLRGSALGWMEAARVAPSLPACHGSPGVERRSSRREGGGRLHFWSSAPAHILPTSWVHRGKLASPHPELHRPSTSFRGCLPGLHAAG
jgi:hypothetical protein